jgi:hypothetical protein
VLKIWGAVYKGGTEKSRKAVTPGRIHYGIYIAGEEYKQIQMHTSTLKSLKD